jgi:hypothetical protein
MPTGITWLAHTSTDLKNALSAASPGDTIILDAGVTYQGNFIFPVKSNSNHKWIYIVSSALASLPAPGTRVNPQTDAANMPKIVTPNMTAALTLSPGANYYRLVGLEITSASTVGCSLTSSPPVNCYSYMLVNAASVIGQPLVDSITVDRCYLHGSPTQDVRQGIEANGSNFAVVDSYISDIHQSTNDSQAILAFYSPGPIKIVNNYLSATTEDVLFGGGGGLNNPWIPSDIEVRNNHFFKPLSWAQVGVTIPPKNQWVEKNNLEFKSARRVLVDSNVMENTWVSGQSGYSVLFTVRTNQSGNIAVVDDITFSNNVLKNVTMGFDTLAWDDVCATTPGCTNAGETRRIKIYNNLILFRDPTAPGASPTYWDVLLMHDLTDFVVQHNTFVLPPGTNKGYQSVYFNGTSYPPPQSITHNVWILDNVLCRQPTGNGGGQGTVGLTNYMGDPAPLAPRFFGNVMYVPTGDKVQQFPVANYATTVPFTYVNAGSGDYRLLTPYWTDTSDGKIAGIDVNPLNAIMAREHLQSMVPGTIEVSTAPASITPVPRSNGATKP